MKNIRSGTTFFLIFNVFIIQDESFYGIHWKRVNFLFILLFTGQCAFLTSYLTSPNKTWTSTSTSPCKCKICISSIESDVYNKKKIQMFGVNMTYFISWSEKKCIFHSCLRHSWNILFFHFTRWNKSHIHSKHLNILYLFLNQIKEQAWQKSSWTGK